MDTKKTVASSRATCPKNLYQVLVNTQVPSPDNRLQSAKTQIAYTNCVFKAHNSDKLLQSYLFDVQISKCVWDNQDSLMILFQDITEKIANIRKQEILQFQQKMISSISHNLKSPLNTIMSLSQVVQLQIADSQQKTMMQYIYNNGEILVHQINSIIQYYHYLQQDVHEQEVTEFSMQKCIEDMQQLYNYEIQQKSISFQIDCEKHLAAETDQNKLKLVILQLIENSIKHNKIGG